MPGAKVIHIHSADPVFMEVDNLKIGEGKDGGQRERERERMNMTDREQL